ncbi:MAG: SpoIIE family protein phosphatase [Phycisphaerales bacterium]
MPDGRVRSLDSTATVLGVLGDHDFESTEERAHCPIGSAIIAYTDGANETTDARDQEFGLSRLRGLIEKGACGELADTIASAVEAHRDGPPADDTLIVEVTLRADAEADA